MNQEDKPLSQEEWKDVSGYEGLYQISNKGRVKSLSRAVKYPDGSVHIFKEKMLKPGLSRGYYLVPLMKNKIPSTVSIHRLIAKVFVSNPENKPQVNHKNGVKTDNRIENLEWVTNKENVQHAVDTGLKISVKGQDVGLSKLTDRIVLSIFNMKEECRLSEIAHLLNIPPQTVSDIIKGKTWNHITGLPKVKRKTKQIYKPKVLQAINESIIEGKVK